MSAPLTSPLGGDDLAKALRDAYGRGYADKGRHDAERPGKLIPYNGVRDAWIAQYIARLPAAEQKGASFGPDHSASPSPSVSALSGECSSRGWQPISTAPKDGTLVAIRGPYLEGGMWESQGWFEAGWGDRCWYDVLDEVCKPTEWKSLAALGTEAEGQDAEGSLVYEGPADLSATPEATPKSYPDQTPVDPQKAVKAFRAAALAAIQDLRHAAACNFSPAYSGSLSQARCDSFYEAYEAVRKLAPSDAPSTTGADRG